ncbi:hypothetical protein M011DRAFT_400451 [Sporormia fimetaria CBS 119925]|uniref:Uncharacterized protein n=1 Tax=Sporormia fimetaria CBS 119925 TaxID=1340428 RepID=A0A6A6VD80_9PLEO|nr:hypothetical protein M011DRAFT_400451 [Sporormia fimetaria CBS 119925]
MADQQQSNAASQPLSPSAIPPPPPLPPSKTSYFSRFVTQPLTTAYASRPPSSQTNPPDGGRPNPLVPRLPGRTAGSSQDASHKTGLDISALDINRDRTHAILAGKEILKTVRVDVAKIVEETNLRAAILNYADRGTAARQRDGLTIHDVKWSHGHFNTHIATAAANGKVILYDLNRAGIELARLHEHTRQVHKLAFNPHQGHLLLSASHDATVRLWDLRALRKHAMTCTSRNQYLGVNGGIRDVQWSPTDCVEFAFGTDNGTIQRWDFRQTKAPKQKVTAHDQRICTSIDWHPDGKHLLSAGVDRTVKVWDFSVDGRRHKPAFVLNTPYPVYNARWRSPHWSDDHHEQGAYQCTQMSTSYDRDHSVIHVWDFRRPYLPYREINKFPTAPTDMLWHSRDTLWTVGREGVFQQNDVHIAAKVIDRRSMQAIAVSSNGEIAAIAQRRPQKQRGAPDHDMHTRKKRSHPAKASLRGSADDSPDEGFVSSSLKKLPHRTSSHRSAKSLGSTPPSDAAPKVMFLTDSLSMNKESFQSHQTSFSGTLPGASNVQIFAYLAHKYKAISLADPPTLQSFLDVQYVFDQNAEYAQRAAYHRLAETWRILGRSVAVATRRRVDLHRKNRLVAQKNSASLPSSRSPQSSLEPLITPGSQAADVPHHPAPLPASGSSQSRQESHSSAAAMASTSNVPTPLARPVTAGESSDGGHQQQNVLPDPDHDDSIQLPQAIAGPHSLGAQGNTAEAHPSHTLAPPQPNFQGPHWYPNSKELDERRAMIGSWRAPPREPLRLEPTNAHGMHIEIPHRLDRHDSDESFAMFSASTDSPRGASMPSSSLGGLSSSQSVPEEWQQRAADYSFGDSQPQHTALSGQDHARTRQSVQISPTAAPIGDAWAGPNVQLQGANHGSAGPGPEAPIADRDENKALIDIANLRRNNQLLRHDSSESEAFASSTGEVSAYSMSYDMDMEASGTIVPEAHGGLRSPQALKPPPASQGDPRPALALGAEDSLLLSDFQAMHVDAEQGSAFAVADLLNQILAFSTDRQSDAQTASIMLLLLTPLLPQTQPTTEPPELASEALAHYSETMAALGLSPEQTQVIQSTQLTEVLKAGINPFQAEAILQTYHTQLHSLALFNAAASIRRLAYPLYPAVYEQALKDTQLGLLCVSCKSPINNPKDKMRCETCHRAQAPCPICWERHSAFEPALKKKSKSRRASLQKERLHRMKPASFIPHIPTSFEFVEDNEKRAPAVPQKPREPQSNLWSWCPLCGHGGHANCLSAWFGDAVLSDGACATEGCLCDCVSGRRRDDKIQEILNKKAEKEKAKAVRKGDDWKVGESRAVSAVRGAVPVGDAGADGKSAVLGPGGGGKGVDGRNRGKKEEGRRVRVVEPGE